MAIQKYFCFELLTAGLIVGWVGLMNAIFSTVSLSIMISDPDYYITNVTDTVVIDPALIVPNVGPATIINILAAGLSFSVIAILTCSMLIMGTIKKNHLMLIPWLINASVSLAYAVVLLIGITIFIVANVNGDIGAAIVTLVIGTLPILLSFYTWCAIFSLYRKLKIEMIGREENQRLLQQQKNYNTSTMA